MGAKEAFRRSGAQLKSCGGKSEGSALCPLPVTASYVFWPGQRRTFVCAKHAARAKRVAAAMAFTLELTPERRSVER
jgi:hypothetical protein